MSKAKLSTQNETRACSCDKPWNYIIIIVPKAGGED